MTQAAPRASSAPTSAESAAPTAVSPDRLHPDTEQTDADMSPPAYADKTIIERPEVAEGATVVEGPLDQAYRATELLPDLSEATPFLVLWPGERHERRVVVELPVTYIGRVPGNQVLIDDTASSRHHARIVREGACYVLVDQNSTNGTFVYDDRGQQWKRVTRCELTDGTQIRIGRVPMCFLLARA